MTNKICPACKSKSLGTDSFCMKCGCDLRNVQVNFVRHTIPYDKECPECKTGNLNFATICRKCGYSFSAIKEQSEQNNNEESIGYSAEKQITDSENELPNRDNNSETWDLILYGSQIIIAFLMIALISNKSSNDNSIIKKANDSNLSSPNQIQVSKSQINSINSTSQNSWQPDTAYVPSPKTSSNDSIEITNASENDVETINSSNTVVNPNGSITVVTSTSTIVLENSKKTLEPQTEVEIEKIFTKVEVEASFPGGDYAWRRYYQNNVHANTPKANGAPEGIYQVIVRFIVSKDGSISDVVAETQHGYGMEAEAVKVIKNAPKWVPAQQNGRNVSSYKRQPITFVVNGD